jgi:hypothetical protein
MLIRPLCPLPLNITYRYVCISMQLQCNPITLVTTLRYMFDNAAVSNFTPGYQRVGGKRGLAVFITAFSFLHKTLLRILITCAPLPRNIVRGRQIVKCYPISENCLSAMKFMRPRMGGWKLCLELADGVANRGIRFRYPAGEMLNARSNLQDCT